MKISQTTTLHDIYYMSHTLLFFKTWHCTYFILAIRAIVSCGEISENNVKIPRLCMCISFWICVDRLMTLAELFPSLFSNNFRSHRERKIILFLDVYTCFDERNRSKICVNYLNTNLYTSLSIYLLNWKENFVWKTNLRLNFRIPQRCQTFIEFFKINRSNSNCTHNERT